MYFNAKEFGQRVKTRRKELEMTQEELADKHGLLTPQHISRIERGVSACSIDMLPKWGRAILEQAMQKDSPKKNRTEVAL